MAVRSSSQRMGPWLLLVKAYQGSRRCSAFPRKQGHSLAWDYGAVCAAAGRCTVDCCLSTTTPEQIALSLTRDSSEMRVAWVMAPAALARKFSGALPLLLRLSRPPVAIECTHGSHHQLISPLKMR
jgi:hypothetical protein